ncbi:hypothetical protein Cgig2_000343 [Carnegiea gigantea]|uniref:Uncharacterized protein n=1 Tax=Carnegiea gigantea TaxID=171969 RepID=A0A9Q1GI14_9CARY|nr:hypothetical protein Cgig2_000343 [Carnegiea gigantea]
MEKTALGYARLLVAGLVTRQKVKFEWKLIKCNHCNLYGHTRDDFRKQKKARQEWRGVVQEETPVDETHPPINEDDVERPRSSTSRRAHFWCLHTNLQHNPKGRILVAYRPFYFKLSIISITSHFGELSVSLRILMLLFVLKIKFGEMKCQLHRMRGYDSYYS